MSPEMGKESYSDGHLFPLGGSPTLSADPGALGDKALMTNKVTLNYTLSRYGSR